MCQFTNRVPGRTMKTETAKQCEEVSDEWHAKKTEDQGAADSPGEDDGRADNSPEQGAPVPRERKKKIQNMA